MSRSVSYASGSVAVAYQTLQDQSEDDDFGAEIFDDVIEDIQEYAPTLWPSFEKTDKWLDREDHAILSNRHAYIGISEYCGLVSVWLVPRDEENNLANQWCASITKKFHKAFGTLNKIGTASNGEAFFERKK